MAPTGTDIYHGGFMNIVIVGCGKVGMVITQQLSSEDHNITLVDEDSEAIAAVTNHYDAMGVVGNGVSYQTLVEAGISDCDLFIAVTDSDEKNLLAWNQVYDHKHGRTSH